MSIALSEIGHQGWECYQCHDEARFGCPCAGQFCGASCAGAYHTDAECERWSAGGPHVVCDECGGWGAKCTCWRDEEPPEDPGLTWMEGDGRRDTGWPGGEM